ncbi:S-adenosyl-L-methionine-dependent methyltransferase [Laetiporus sulphureus 93-53]|uniref:S-adenosyl-L-methionine-dependent methyltransferase n=1 Tax=Laetiporus sulphureus 93-53 TaxID=1314785 RepID=A0A165G1Y6_9APHY|nr:S-adenosyl-L-methionine-dependent methyltransferase [Laetiporus sulphureus 93-53]KZT09719.1 S-adenosyl-L-methionine-dependent methyltransferase [Laetiporus sulphureus 93-53]
MSKVAPYINGHQESVLRAHSWRTVQNSAGYLLSSLKPDMHILDLGCGPGTITIDFATLVPQGSVIGLENVEGVLEQARANASAQGVQNVKFVLGDALKLDFPDDTFDVVHAHQVLQHVGDPVGMLREMRRVTKPGGIVATRESDFATVTFFPESETMEKHRDLHLRTARALGGEPLAGRRLVSWAMKAGFERSAITASASAWCYSTPEERALWSTLWADRVLKSSFATQVLELGFGTQEDLEEIAQAVRDWGAHEDGWIGVMHGEVLCRV